MRLSSCGPAPVPWGRGTKRFIFFVAVLAPSVAWSQALLSELSPGSSMRLSPSDSVVLDLGEPKNDLPCIVRPVKPELGFDFRFHSGYQVAIAMNELASAQDLLILFRVISERRPYAPAYFFQKIHVPVLEDGIKGRAEFTGALLLGEGKYHVDWLMRDMDERFCSTSWDVEARVDARDAQMSQDRRAHV